SHMPLPSGMTAFGAAAGAGVAGGGVAAGAGGAVLGGVTASAACVARASAAGPATPAAAGAAGAVVGGSAARGDVVGGTSSNWSPPERAAAVSSFVGETGRPKAVATPIVSTRSDRNRTWRCRGRPESMRRGMDRLLSRCRFGQYEEGGS